MLRQLALKLLIMGLGLDCIASAADTVYSHDFEKPAGTEWSSDKIEETPQGQRHFLGGFTTDKLTLKLDKLPKHTHIRISMELFIMATWDGNADVSSRGAKIGPDVWKMGIENGVELVNATFSNMGEDNTYVVDAARRQSFPSVLQGDNHPARSGAAESGTLGFEWMFGDRITRPIDSVYKLSFTVPHNSADIQLYFQGAEGLQPGDDECWGLDNVKIETLDVKELPKLDDIALRKLWETVGGTDPAAEARAFWKLVAGGDDVARFLRGKVKKAGIDRKAFNKLLIELGGDDFKTRENASTELEKLGAPAQALLHEAMQDTESAEVKTRLEAVLKNLAKSPPTDPDERRYQIALKMLGIIATPEAHKVMKEIMEK